MEQKNSVLAAPRKAPGLNSWKEIANHLGVNVRTAQKWERRRGLPVRRGTGRRSRVSAEVAELEVWRSRLLRLREPEDQLYRWPLGAAITVEVRFLGSGMTAEHVDLLLDYLKLFKKAMAYPG